MSASPADRDAFRVHFGAEPDACVHAPGRVNLMGDHIDYLGLPVLPMALRQGIQLLVRARSDRRVRIANVDTAYPPEDFAVVEPPRTGGAWGDYVRAGIRAVDGAVGFDALVSATLPAAAGLSSSSALVVASALAALHVMSRTVPPTELAELLARGERLVGTEGGGMDQAVSLCAVEGHALRIAFQPLRLRPVPMPANWLIAVAPSLQVSHKAGALRAAYNERSRSARSGVAAIAGDITGDELLLRLRSDPESFDSAARHLPRLRHVLSEAIRVDQAVHALERGDLPGFGRLMTESHVSLRDDYEVSTPELDRLVDSALAAGAAGARLTGAGFGGCVIALCTPESLPHVWAAWLETFYRSRGDDAAFDAHAGGGARVALLGS